MGNMKDIIKHVSVDQFYRRGYFATSISDIAKGAGIQKASIYHHYPSKEHILVDILKTTMLDLMDNLKRHLEGVAGAVSQLTTAIESHIHFHIERQKEVLISDSELRGLSPQNYRAVIQMRDEYEKVFESILQKGMQEKVFRSTDPKVAAYAILAMCTAVCMWFNSNGRLSDRKVSRLYSELVLKGLQTGTADNHAKP